MAWPHGLKTVEHPGVMASRPFQFVAPRAAKFAEDLLAAIVQVVVPRQYGHVIFAVNLKV